MRNYKLNNIRMIVLEVNRLEAMSMQISKSRDGENKTEFYENLKWCREEKEKLMRQNLLDDLYLSDGEKEMAKNYYYKGMRWADAFENSSLFEEIDVEDDKEYERKLCNSKKAIIRAIEKYYPYYKKK